MPSWEEKWEWIIANNAPEACLKNYLPQLEVKYRIDPSQRKISIGKTIFQDASVFSMPYFVYLPLK